VPRNNTKMKINLKLKLVKAELLQNHVEISQLTEKKETNNSLLSVNSTKLIILVVFGKLLKELLLKRDSLKIQTLLVPTKLKKNHVTISKLSKKMIIKLLLLSVDST
jgi:hypothetical protein